MTNTPTKAEAIESIKDCMEGLRVDIAGLESFFSVTTIDAWPYVVALKTKSETPALMQKVGPDSYNFAGHNRNAMQFSKASAERIAKELAAADGREYEVIGKRDAFRTLLNCHQETLASFQEMLDRNAD